MTPNYPVSRSYDTFHTAGKTIPTLFHFLFSFFFELEEVFRKRFLNFFTFSINFFRDPDRFFLLRYGRCLGDIGLSNNKFNLDPAHSFIFDGMCVSIGQSLLLLSF